VQNLTDQVEDTQQHYEREKTRPEVEKSPRDRIQELEDELVTACAQLDQLKQERTGNTSTLLIAIFVYFWWTTWPKYFPFGCRL